MRDTENVYDQNDPPPKPTAPNLDRRATLRDVPWVIVFTMAGLIVGALAIWFWPGDEEPAPTDTSDLSVGDCLDISGRGSRTELIPVPCDGPHGHQVYLVLSPVLGEGDPADCEPGWQAADVALDRLPAEVTFSFVEPTQQGISLGIRSVVCLVDLPDGFTGSVLAGD